MVEDASEEEVEVQGGEDPDFTSDMEFDKAKNLPGFTLMHWDGTVPEPEEKVAVMFSHISNYE